MRALLATAVLAHLLPAVVAAAPADLDPTFGSAGSAILADSTARAAAVAVGPAGEIVIAGYLSTGSATEFIVARLLDDGTPDPAFGIGGVQSTPVGIGASARSVVVQPDGRIVAAGTAGVFLDGNMRNTVTVVRYLPDGSLDPSFDEDGVAFTWIPGTGETFVADVVLQADGAIVVAGSVLAGEDRFDGYDALLVRFTPDGALDASFGAGGVVTTAFAPYDDFLSGVELDASGRIVVGGRSGIDRINDGVAAHFVFTLARYLADGTLDPSFGTGGKVTTDVRPAGNASMTGLVLQDDGTIHSVGSSSQKTAPGPGIVVTRHAADGTLEAITDTPKQATLQLEGVGRDPDGRVLVTGTLFTDGSHASGNVGLVRFTHAGALDSTFGAGGIVHTDVAGNVDQGAAVTTDASGRILVAGHTFDGDSLVQIVLFRHAGGTCVDGAACDDGDACTAGETCAAGACPGPAAPDGTACDDRSVCTSGETCTGGVCGSGTSITCDDCFACDAYAGCRPAPEPVCAEADDSRLTVGRDGMSPLRWRWRGDGPDASVGMKLCIFQERDVFGSVQLAARTTDVSSCTSDGCWRGGRRAIRYSSRAEGLARISWRSGKLGRDRVRLRTRGSAPWLQFGSPPIGVPLLVQLTDDGGGCWQSRDTLPVP